MREVNLLASVNTQGLKNVLAALESVPDKRLVRGMLWDRALKCGCLIGAIYPNSERRSAEYLTQGGIASIVKRVECQYFWEFEDAKEWGERMGINTDEVRSLEAYNDSVQGDSASRYEAVLAGLKKEVSTRNDT